VLRQALDQVAAQLNGANAGPEERDRVVAMLQAAAAWLGGTRDGGTRDGLDPLASLGLASDEEMFQFIDNL
jgi:hypothetical protein